MLAAVVFLCLLVVVVPSVHSVSRHMARSPDVYCAATALQQLPARKNEQKCAADCLKHDQCVAFSHRADLTCHLYGDFCGQADITTETAAVYAEVEWECSDTSCYYMPTLKTPKNKAGADADCAAMGAHVVAPETAEEDALVKEIIFGKGYVLSSGSVWIDLVDDTTWAHSGAAITHTHWGPNEPNSSINEHCTFLRSIGDWVDNVCSLVRPFICEKEN